MAKKDLVMVDDLDMEVDDSELDMSPEYVDMSAGSYFLRVAGFTKSPTEVEDPETGDTIPATRRSIVFQIVGIKAAVAPQPEIGGIFAQGGIMAYQIARDQFIRLVKKIIKVGEPSFLEEKHTMGEKCQKCVELFDKEQFLLCTIAIRDGQYPNIRTMQRVDVSAVEDWDEESFQFAEFEYKN